jgi:hypothetical protein
MNVDVLATIYSGHRNYRLLDLTVPLPIPSPDGWEEEVIHLPVFLDERDSLCTLSRTCTTLLGYRQADTLRRLLTERSHNIFVPGYHYRLERGEVIKGLRVALLDSKAGRFRRTAKSLERVRTEAFLYLPCFPLLPTYSKIAKAPFLRLKTELEKVAEIFKDQSLQESVIDTFLGNLVEEETPAPWRPSGYPENFSPLDDDNWILQCYLTLFRQKKSLGPNLPNLFTLTIPLLCLLGYVTEEGNPTEQGRFFVYRDGQNLLFHIWFVPQLLAVFLEENPHLNFKAIGLLKPSEVSLTRVRQLAKFLLEVPSTAKRILHGLEHE